MYERCLLAVRSPRFCEYLAAFDHRDCDGSPSTCDGTVPTYEGQSNILAIDDWSSGPMGPNPEPIAMNHLLAQVLFLELCLT
jgi:hypothetical protein